MSKFLIPVIVLTGLMAGAARAQWLETTIGVGSNPCALVYDSVNNKVYCANSGSASVTVIDGKSNQVVATVYVGDGPDALCYNPQDNKVYCANWNSADVTVIGGASDSVVKTIAVGSYPQALTCNPAQNRIYVANFSSNSISIIRDSALGVAERAPLVEHRLSLEAEPNPFSGRVRLQVMVSGDTIPNRSGSGHVPGLRVYDVNGKLVRTLWGQPPSFPRPQSRGETPGGSPLFLTWDGTDGAGRRVPPGVYVVRLTDDAESVNRKVMLLR